ncbi:MAG: hypothetical protein NTX25_23055 [Proteobacteria bacterium]|nr:hypothetical protein [Pseudomonadota bacterium]
MLKAVFTIYWLALLVTSCDGTGAGSVGTGAVKSLWTEQQIKDGT